MRRIGGSSFGLLKVVSGVAARQSPGLW